MTSEVWFFQSFNGSVDNTSEACMVKQRELSLRVMRVLWPVEVWFFQRFNGSVDGTLEACMVKQRELRLSVMSVTMCNRCSAKKGIDETEATLKPKCLLAVNNDVKFEKNK